MTKTLLRSLMLILACAWALAAQAQKMAVAGFQPDQSDQTANQQGTMVRDQNGDACALIKINTTEHGFDFDCGSMAVMKVEDGQHAGQVWVYVQDGTKKITIGHPELGSLEYRLPETLRKGRTYKMDLTSDRVVTNVFNDDKSQKFTLVIDAPESRSTTVKFNGVVEQVPGNVWTKELSYGTHSYVVEAPDYYRQEGKIKVGAGQPTTQTVKLKPRFGWLKMEGANELDFSDVSVFVDNKPLGFVGADSLRLGSGIHDLRLRKPLYEELEKDFTITDGATLTLPVDMKADFDEVRITCADPYAEIWIDGERRATGTFEGNLGLRGHTVQARRDKHYTQTMEIDVVKGQNNHFGLPRLQPMTGTLAVTTPKGTVDIWIDGKKAGRTPYSETLVIGPHEVKLQGRGFRTKELTVAVAENQTTRQDVTLDDVVDVTFDLSPWDMTLTCDDRYGAINGAAVRAATFDTGHHTLYAERDGYFPVTKEHNFIKDGENIAIHLRPIRFRPNSMYIDFGGQAGEMNAGSINIGGYISNVNVEVGIGFPFGGAKVDGYVTPSGNDDRKWYANLYGDLRLGYGITFGRHIYWLRITPQVGVRLIGGSNKYMKFTREKDPELEHAEALAVLGGAKVQFAFSRHFGFYVEPLYSIRAYGVDNYKMLADVNSKIKGWTDGFSVAFGFFIQ